MPFLVFLWLWLCKNTILLLRAVLTDDSIYTIGPLDVAITQTATGYPFIDMIYAATNSLAATNVMTAVVIINFTGSAIAVLATASRQLWAFARNRGVPFSSFLAPVSTVAPKLSNASLILTATGKTFI
jgi:amino acid transporter